MTVEEAMNRRRRAVLESLPVGLTSLWVGPLGGCVGSPSFTIQEFDAAYRTDTGSTWWPWLEVTVKNTGSGGGTVGVTAKVTVDGGASYSMTGEVSLEPDQFEQVMEGRPADAEGFEEGSRSRFVAAVWLGEAEEAARRETVTGDES